MRLSTRVARLSHLSPLFHTRIPRENKTLLVYYLIYAILYMTTAQNILTREPYIAKPLAVEIIYDISSQPKQTFDTFLKSLKMS